MACHLYNTERCLQLQLFKRPNFGVHFSSCHLNIVIFLGIDTALLSKNSIIFLYISPIYLIINTISRLLYHNAKMAGRPLAARGWG